MKNKTTFQIQFFDGRKAVWKPAGLHTFTTLDEAKAFKAGQVKMTGGLVDFRVVEVTAY